MSIMSNTLLPYYSFRNTPHLSCLHTVCRACVEYKCLTTCPPQTCNVPIPKQQAVATITYVAKQQRIEWMMEVQECINKAEKITSISPLINRAKDSMSNFVIVTKAEEVLVKLAKAQKDLVKMMKKEHASEAFVVDMIGNHVEKCHALLDWECNRLRGKLLENLKVSDDCMLDDLLDIVERLAASQFKNHLDINEGIFGMLEKHIEIKSPLKH